MTVRITLKKEAYVGWNGRKTLARTQVREFADHAEAANWLVEDSYFAESYTRHMTWEVIDEPA